MLFLMQPIELWTGKQVFSVLLRPNASVKVYVTLNVKEKSFKKGEFDETMCKNDGWVYFRNSELISGQLGKATLGKFKMKCNMLQMHHTAFHSLFFLYFEKFDIFL